VSHDSKKRHTHFFHWHRFASNNIGREHLVAEFFLFAVANEKDLFPPILFVERMSHIPHTATRATTKTKAFSVFCFHLAVDVSLPRRGAFNAVRVLDNAPTDPVETETAHDRAGQDRMGRICGSN
jgi:hypothetical protein